jgi:hypothetical protein
MPKLMNAVIFTGFDGPEKLVYTSPKTDSAKELDSLVQSSEDLFALI